MENKTLQKYIWKYTKISKIVGNQQINIGDLSKNIFNAFANITDNTLGGVANFLICQSASCEKSCKRLSAIEITK